MSMVISAIVPCHNAERWILDALRSVSLQTRPPNQVVIVDDASTDASLALIETWAAHAPQDVVIKHLNFRNAAATRNVAIEESRGDWVAFLDADDQWVPEHLSEASSLLSGTSDIAFLGHKAILSMGGNLIRPSDNVPLAPTGSGLDAHTYLKLVAEKKRWRFNHSTILYNKSRLLSVGGFDPTFIRRHDIDLWLRVVAEGTWTYDAQVHAHIRQTLGSLSSNKADASFFHLRALVKNELLLPYPETKKMLHHEAFRALSHGWTDGSINECTRARKLAAPLLSLSKRLTLWPFMLWSAPYRALNKLRRSLTNKFKSR